MRRAVIPLFLVMFSSISYAENAALIVIDMQPNFAERKGYHVDPENITKLNAVLQRQRELIELAKETHMPILTIEYCNYGSTCDSLKSAMGDYPDARTYVKRTDG